MTRIFIKLVNHQKFADSFFSAPAAIIAFSILLLWICNIYPPQINENGGEMN